MFIGIFITTRTGPLLLPSGDKFFAEPLGRLRIGRQADCVGHLGNVPRFGHNRAKRGKSGFANLVG